MIAVNTALVLKEVLAGIVTKISDIKFAYDSGLEYKEGVTSLRGTDELKEKIVDAGEHPLMIFNRSVLKRFEPMGRKMDVELKNTDTTTRTVDIYKAGYAEFDFNYAIVTPNIERLDQIEIEHVIGYGMESLRSVTVDLGGTLGEFKYNIEWEEFEDLQVVTEGSFYKAITGKAKVTGWFMILKSTGGGVIEEINFNISTFIDDYLVDNVLLETKQILAPPP